MSVTTMDKSDDPGLDIDPAPRKRRKFVVTLLVFLLVGGASWFYLRPSTEEAPPEPGAVLTLEPIQLNLAAGRYLRVGIALQGVVGGHEELDGSKALDATIELFSGRKMEDLSQPDQRSALKEKLQAELLERYHGEVIDVYFTDFVTQ